jgi:hypothetical protein
MTEELADSLKKVQEEGKCEHKDVSEQEDILEGKLVFFVLK